MRHIKVSYEDDVFEFLENRKKEVYGSAKLQKGRGWHTFILDAVKKAYPEKTKEKELDEIEDLWSVKHD